MNAYHQEMHRSGSGERCHQLTVVRDVSDLGCQDDNTHWPIESPPHFHRPASLVCVNGSVLEWHKLLANLERRDRLIHILHDLVEVKATKFEGNYVLLNRCCVEQPFFVRRDIAFQSPKTGIERSDRDPHTSETVSTGKNWQGRANDIASNQIKTIREVVKSLRLREAHANALESRVDAGERQERASQRDVGVSEISGFSQFELPAKLPKRKQHSKEGHNCRCPPPHCGNRCPIEAAEWGERHARDQDLCSDHLTISIWWWRNCATKVGHA